MIMGPSHNKANYYLTDQVSCLTDCRDRDVLDQTLARVLVELLKPLSVTMYMIMADLSDLRWIPVLRQEPGQPVELRDPIHADFYSLECMVEGTPRYRCLDVNLTVTIHASDNGGKFKTCLPLFAGYSRVDSGVVEIESVSRLTLDDLATIDRVLRVYRNMHSMFLYSERDALTGLFNRKSFEDTFFKSLRSNPNMQLAEHAPREGSVEVERRTSAPSEHFWLAMVDVDHFKQVNDKFGHHIGDEVLILVARIMKNTFRGYDRVYRFGGEEFVVLMRSAWHDSALATLERFRKNMEEYSFPQVGQITVSVGMNIINGGDPPNVVCDKADQAVYYAKRNGRNQVRSYMDLVEKGLIETEVQDGGIELF
jgi:diguanylate cyclase (GGDEF)-like protein